MQRSPGDIRDQMSQASQARVNDTAANHAGARSSPGAQQVTHLMLVVIHLQDYQKTARALEKINIPVLRLASSGAFLGRRNVTLLTPLAEDQQEQALQIIQTTCRQRVEYISTPLEGAPMPLPLSTPVHVGGASIFTLPVEMFVEF
jgi:uncharacterized protein YaaQ